VQPVDETYTYTAKHNHCHLELCAHTMKTNIMKQLCVCLAVHKLPTVLLATDTSRVADSISYAFDSISM